MVSGGSTATGIENNVVSNTPSQATCLPPPGAAGISVSADSTAQAIADYNLLFQQAANALYNWSGTAYPSPSAFQAATGQGAHDLNTSPGITSTFHPTEKAPLIDSADANAPGELSTDADGKPRVDDPLVDNTGTGSGFVDRGAYEFQDPFAVTAVTVSPDQGPFPLLVTATAVISNPWSTVVTYTWDFGDGSAQKPHRPPRRPTPTPVRPPRASSSPSSRMPMCRTTRVVPARTRRSW